MAHETSSLTSAQLNEKLRHLRGLTCEWTLSEDDELCSVLDELSRSLVSRVDATLGKLNSSTAATTRAVVNVANMDTHLASFANDQFIESRVYDEPCVVSAEPPRSVKKTAQRQEETVENICEAVSLSFAMIKSHFKRIEMRPEDFDEDDDPTFIPDPVFEPFDSHLSRPLPFLIGTNDWNTSLSAGVRDTPVELAKVQKDEVVIGLPAFVQPHLATAATSCPQPTQPQVMNAVRGIDEEKERAIGKMAESADSRRSDHSGLFSSDSTDDEATINKEPSRSYNTGPTWRGVAAEPFVPPEHSGASRGRQVEEAPDTKQAFAPNAPRSPTFTHVTSTPPGMSIRNLTSSWNHRYFRMSSVSEKAVFRSGTQLPPDFANRLSGLILTASKHASGADTGSAISKGKPPNKAPSGSSLEDTISTDATGAFFRAFTTVRSFYHLAEAQVLWN